MSIAKRCQILEQRCEQLKQAMRSLTDQHRDLLLRHNLLQAWCESLSLIQLNKMSQLQLKNAGATGEYKRLLEQEMSLLDALTSSDPISNQDAASTLEVGVSYHDQRGPGQDGQGLRAPDWDAAAPPAGVIT